MVDRTSLVDGGHPHQWLGVALAAAAIAAYAVYAERRPQDRPVGRGHYLAARGDNRERIAESADRGDGSGIDVAAVRPNWLERLILKLAGDDPDELERRAVRAADDLATYRHDAALTYLEGDFFPERRKPGSRMR